MQSNGNDLLVIEGEILLPHVESNVVMLKSDLLHEMHI